MLVFEIPTMSCDHCVRAITEAVRGADPQATVRPDLAARRVEVHTTAARETIVAELQAAGYPPGGS